MLLLLLLKQHHIQRIQAIKEHGRRMQEINDQYSLIIQRNTEFLAEFLSRSQDIRKKLKTEKVEKSLPVLGLTNPGDGSPNFCTALLNTAVPEPRRALSTVEWSSPLAGISEFKEVPSLARSNLHPSTLLKDLNLGIVNPPLVALGQDSGELCTIGRRGWN